MELPKVPKGAHTHDFNGMEFEVGCVTHRGREVVSRETRDDPATNKPRLVTFVDGSGQERPVLTTNPDTGESSYVVAEFPVYSEDTGYDPDCIACQAGIINTYEHAAMRQVADARGAMERELEFVAEAKRRGLM